MPTLLFQRSSLKILAVCLAVAGVVGGMQRAAYSLVHTIDCEASAAIRHPACQEGVVLLVNGQIHTQSPRGVVEALAVQRGRVVAIGTSQRMRADYPEASKIDLGTYPAYPGFQDWHVRLLDGGLSLLPLNLERAETRHQVREAIKAHIAQRPEAPWVIGQGWSLTSLGGRPLTRRTLDILLEDRPIFLWDRDISSASVNSRALALLGIDRQTPDLPNGRIDRDRTGRPTGYLEGAAAERAFDQTVHLLPGAFLKQALLDAQAHFLSQGITRVGSVQTHGLAEIGAIGELLESALWRLRVRALSPALGLEGVAMRLFRSPDPETLQVEGRVLRLDGRLAQRTAALSLPYPDGSASVQPWYSAEQVREVVGDLSEEGLMLQVAGDEALRTALEGLSGTTDGARVRVAAMFWSDQMLHRAASRGIAVLISPVTARRRWLGIRHLVPRSMGPEAYRLGSLVAAGIPVVMGSGWPSIPSDPIAHLVAAAHRADADGEAEAWDSQPPWTGDEHVGMGAMLRAYTSNGAQMAGISSAEGQLGAGAMADVVVVSQPMDDLALERLETHEVVMTVVGGEVVWRRDGGLQIRTGEKVLEAAPASYKILARQHFPFLVLVLGVCLWPCLVLLRWAWVHRPRPQPLRVIAPSLSLRSPRQAPDVRRSRSRRG